jgi:hypothetical protein
MRRILTAAVAGVVALSLGAAAIAGAIPSGAAGSAANEAAAQAAGTRMLAGLNLPPGAQPSPTAPADPAGILTVSATIGGDNLVHDVGWWVVPGAPQAVLGYIADHGPQGSSSAGIGTGGAGGEAVWNEGLQFADVPGVLAQPTVFLEAVVLSDGSTGLRADAEVLWITARPTADALPPGIAWVRITLHGSVPGGQQHTFAVTRARQVHDITAAFADLEAPQPIIRTGCLQPTRPTLIRASFYGRTGRTPLAVADVNPYNCATVAMTVHGRREPPLSNLQAHGSQALDTTLSGILGADFKLASDL